LDTMKQKTQCVIAFTINMENNRKIENIHKDNKPVNG
jgi:hypothetical protein